MATTPFHLKQFGSVFQDLQQMAIAGSYGVMNSPRGPYGGRGGLCRERVFAVVLELTACGGPLGRLDRRPEGMTDDQGGQFDFPRPQYAVIPLVRSYPARRIRAGRQPPRVLVRAPGRQRLDRPRLPLQQALQVSATSSTSPPRSATV